MQHKETHVNPIKLFTPSRNDKKCNQTLNTLPAWCHSRWGILTTTGVQVCMCTCVCMWLIAAAFCCFCGVWADTNQPPTLPVHTGVPLLCRFICCSPSANICDCRRHPSFISDFHKPAPGESVNTVCAGVCVWTVCECVDLSIKMIWFTAWSLVALSPFSRFLIHRQEKDRWTWVFYEV